MGADSQRGRGHRQSRPPVAPRTSSNYEAADPTIEVDGASIASSRRPTPLPDGRIPPPAASAPPAKRARFVSETRAKTGRHKRAGLVDGRYELEAMISKGGMGRVFRARHRDLGRKVALKLVLEGMQDDNELREIFFREARLASSLSHPNIINVTDFGLDDDLGYFLVMDFIEGETLRERMRQKNSSRFSFEIIDQVTGAVRYIHGRDIVHCDLKPENVLLARSEGEQRRSTIVKLLDFGLSWRRETLPDPKLGGTPPYLAPERLRGAPPSPLCDVYSLGMMLYELIAGELPFKGTVAQMIDRQLNGEVPPPPSLKATDPVDPRADTLVLRALSRSPEARHPSAEAFQFELRAVMGMMGMKVRRNALVVESRPALDADVTMHAVMESPVPLGIFATDGSVRLANRSFVDALEGVQIPVANFNELAISRRHPELHGLFQRAVEGKGPLSSVVLGGAEGGERSMILWIAPLIKDRAVLGVHMTLVGSSATG
jgi:tRNA A-37 threonylcarbamoyl transferase component Bud32